MSADTMVNFDNIIPINHISLITDGWIEKEKSEYEKQIGRRYICYIILDKDDKVLIQVNNKTVYYDVCKTINHLDKIIGRNLDTFTIYK